MDILLAGLATLAGQMAGTAVDPIIWAAAILAALKIGQFRWVVVAALGYGLVVAVGLEAISEAQGMGEPMLRTIGRGLVMALDFVIIAALARWIRRRIKPATA